MFAFFSVKKRRPCRPTALLPQQVVVRPPSSASCHQAQRSSPHGKAKVIHYPMLRGRNLYTLSRRTVNGTAAWLMNETLLDIFAQP